MFPGVRLLQPWGERLGWPGVAGPGEQTRIALHTYTYIVNTVFTVGYIHISVPKLEYISYKVLPQGSLPQRQDGVGGHCSALRRQARHRLYAQVTKERL